MKEEKKTEGELLREQLIMEPKNSTAEWSDEVLSEADRFCEGYKQFLDACKTEREAVKHTVALLESRGYEPFDVSKSYRPGDKVYRNNRGKALIFAIMGKRPVSDGVRLVISHIDSPRLDLKPRPLYEEAQLGYLKTHYYGGLKKYQWTALPLALHGVIIRKDGVKVEVSIGDQPGDPVFCVTDLLPHLATEQSKRPLSQGIKGEELNILIGSRCFKDDKVSERVKLNLARLLFEKYGVVEEDFLSADLSLVPAGRAQDVGLDRSMVGAYGQDDRVCAYTSLQATLETEEPEYTVVTIFGDKEETGSDSNTGMNSAFAKYFIADLAQQCGVPVRHVLSRSKCLSADVNCAFDPNFPDPTERRNTAYLNYGVVVTKYTGSGGKYSTSEATAEFMAEVRRMLDEHEVTWQTGMLGKVDFGGGGTIAKYIAKLDVDVVDVGVPVLSMHSPFEITAKTDVYMTYRAFKAFMA